MNHFTKQTSRTADKFVVRLPDGMRNKICDASNAAHRSMNSEIIARLEQSLAADGILASAPQNTTSLTQSEQMFMQHFRQLAARQRNALIALIVGDAQGAAKAA